MSIYKTFSTRKTPQNQKIPGSNQVKNSAGGYSYQVDDWVRLDRFLILGSDGGSYYASPQKLTIDNAEAVLRCVKKDGIRVVSRIVEISHSGRAPKNDPALFALAMAAGEGDSATRRAALQALPKVARTGMHWFYFVMYAKQFRGWGRGLREAVARLYTDSNVDDLAYQLIKYRQRDGWTHVDLMRLAHPKPRTEEQKALFLWVVRGQVSDLLPDRVRGFIKLQNASSPKDAAKIISEYKMPREAVPTHFLNSAVVWDALLTTGMPLTAMIRNLGKMTSVGLLKPMSDAANRVSNNLMNADRLRHARIHPLSLLVALKTYQRGHGMRGNLSWKPVREIVDALDEAFYLSFGSVEATGKRTMLALDVSGSMTCGNIAGMPITPREASAAMAMVTARTEPHWMVTAFSHALTSVNISPRQRLDNVIHTIHNMSMGKTDCALPMIYALDNKIEVDTFVIYTDSETWYGKIHPKQALYLYRQKTGIPAKLAVVGMVSNGFSIADPDDAGMLDVVGFDIATPQILSNFSIGKI